MAYHQFAHVQAYSRSSSKNGGHSVSNIIDEAVRVPDASQHVENPQAPRLLYKNEINSLRDLEKLSEQYAESMTQKVTRTSKNGNQTTYDQKYQKHGNVMLAGVFSLSKDQKNTIWNDYKRDFVKELKEQYGDRLKAVIEHVDEEHPHCHFYVIPKAGEKFENIHDGIKAQNKAKSEGKKGSEQIIEYKKAMSAWQNKIHDKVSARYDLDRFGPNRKRLTRDENNARKHDQLKHNKAIKNAQETIKKAKVIADHAKNKLNAVNAHEQQLKTIGGKLSVIIGAASTVKSFAKDLLVSKKLWPGASQADRVKQKAIEELKKKDKEKLELERKLEDESNKRQRVERKANDLETKANNVEFYKRENEKLHGHINELASELKELKPAHRKTQSFEQSR